MRSDAEAERDADEHAHPELPDRELDPRLPRVRGIVSAPRPPRAHVGHRPARHVYVLPCPRPARLGRGLLDRDDLVCAPIAPWRRRAIADADRDHRKRRRLLRPRRVAIGDDDQEIDRRALPLGEPAQAGADVRSAAAVQLHLRGREHLFHIVDDDITAGDDDLGAVTELTRQSAEFGDGPRELRILHRAGRVDQKPRPGPG